MTDTQGFDSPAWPPMLPRKDVPAYLSQQFGIRLTAQTIAVYASQGIGPPVTKFGPRAYYDVEQLNRWVAERTRRPSRETA